MLAADSGHHCAISIHLLLHLLNHDFFSARECENRLHGAGHVFGRLFIDWRFNGVVGHPGKCALAPDVLAIVRQHVCHNLLHRDAARLDRLSELANPIYCKLHIRAGVEIHYIWPLGVCCR